MRLEAHNIRQRERWTAAGGSSRRRSRDKVEAPGTAEQQQPAMPPQPAHPPAFAAGPAEQARAAVMALFGMPAAAMPPIVTPGQDDATRLEALMHGQHGQQLGTPWPSSPLAAQPYGRMSLGGGGVHGRVLKARRTICSASDVTCARAFARANNRDGLPSWAGHAPRSPRFASGASPLAANTFGGGGNRPGPGTGLEVEGTAPLDQHRSCDIARLLGQSAEVAPQHHSWEPVPLQLEYAQTMTGSDSPGASATSHSCGGGMRLRSWSANAILPLVAGEGSGDHSSDTAPEVQMTDLGLKEAEARAFAEQAPEPLLLAQRLMGLEMPAWRRPEFSYGAGQPRRRSLDSQTRQLNAHVDQAVAYSGSLGPAANTAPSSPWGRSPPATPLPPGPQAMKIPQVAAQSGPWSGAHPANLALGSFWDTNEGILHGAYDTQRTDAAPTAPIHQWPQQHPLPVQRIAPDPAYGRISLEALEQAAERRVPPLPSAVPHLHGLADGGQQRSAPLLPGVGRWGLPSVDFGSISASVAAASAAPRLPPAIGDLPPVQLRQ